MGKSAEARQLLQEVRDPTDCPDTQHLHRALFAAYDDNWGVAADELRQALAETDGRLPPQTREDWFRASAVLLHLGFGERLVALLTDAAADVNLLPWFAAVDAHHHGDRRHLGNIPLEARSSAEQIYDEIELRRSQLPQKTRRKSRPLAT